MALLLRVNVEDKSEHRAGLGINLIFLASIHSISCERERESSGCSEVTLTECKYIYIYGKEWNYNLTKTCKM